MLDKFLVTELFAFLLVFCRLGSAIMVLPGFGEGYVPPQIRLMLALMISLIITPIAEPYMPKVPGSPLGLGILVIAEIMVGIFMGLISRLLISAMHTAGMIIAMQSGLAAAMMFDINAGSQGSPFGNLLSLGAVTMLFALDLHHVMLSGLADSYTLFAPGLFPPVDDFANMASSLASSIFVVAMAFSAPHLAVGLLIYLGAGILSRLMPAMQVFFILVPVQVAISFFILLASLSSGYLMYMNFYENTLTGYLNPQ